MALFSELCPIFHTGVENEIVFPNYKASSTLSLPVAQWTPGREVVVHEAWANVYGSTTAFACTSNSCTIYIYSDASLSTKIGSICIGSDDLSASGGIRKDASLTSTSLGSTDTLVLANYTFAGMESPEDWPVDIVVRYRES